MMIVFIVAARGRWLAILLLLLTGSLALADPDSPRALRSEPLSSSETMRHALLLDGTSVAFRCQWYRSRLQPLEAVVDAAARAERIPPRLLATVILNELADIDLKDVAQDIQLDRTQGNPENLVHVPTLLVKPIGEQSFGIAQITPKTAIEHRAVPVGGRLYTPEELEFAVAYRLLDRPSSVRAAARIVRGILDRLELQTRQPWVQSFLIPGLGFSAARPHESLLPVLNSPTLRQRVALDREKNLAQLVAAVYNSARILNITADELRSEEYYKDARKHGDNAKSIAEDLAQTAQCGLRLSDWPHSQPVAPPSVVGAWSFGRSREGGKAVQRHLCDLDLTPGWEAQGFVIKSCHQNESYWDLLANGELTFRHKDGNVTSRFKKVRDDYWEGPYYIHPDVKLEGVTHYLKRR